MTFVHAARNPKSGLSSAGAHMTGSSVLFKASAELIPRNDEQSRCSWPSSPDGQGAGDRGMSARKSSPGTKPPLRSH
jgi:hypothetical protein